MEPLFSQPLRHAPVEGGTIAYEDSGGGGPAVLCVPGMGDLRQEYRLHAPRLVAAGRRVLAMDLRGHGESSTAFTRWGADAVGADALAVLAHAGVAHATLVGCSMAAAAAAWAAAESPGVVDGVVLIGPFARDQRADRWFRPLTRVLFARPWGAWVWRNYYRHLYVARPPADLDGYARALGANLAERGRVEALGHMLRASKQPATARLAAVRAPALIVMGARDPDFRDPAAEAAWLQGALGGGAAVALVDGAGHYPHVESPDEVAARILALPSAEAHHAA